MATLGQTLPLPEEGWIRYDDTDIIFKYSSGFIPSPNASYFNGSSRLSSTANSTVEFHFKGTKLRIIGNKHNRGSSNISITIDGVTETFSEYHVDIIQQALVYEKLNLSNTLHTVKISTNDTNFVLFDAIDVSKMLYRTLVYIDGLYYYYSNSWNQLSSTAPTEQDYIGYGMDDLSIIPDTAWAQFQEEIELCCYTNDPTKTEISFKIETEPFTLAEEWQDKEINVVEYTDDPQQTESTISIETESFTLYDELGDNVDVLYYTDELTKTTASLEYNANYSPLDEIYNNFEVVTWTDESNSPFKLSLGALPVNQFIKQSNDFTLPGSLQAITIVKNASDNAKFLLSFDSGQSWKTYRYGKWIEVIVDDINTIRKQAMSYKEISKLVESNFKNQGEKIRFGYYIEDKKQESLNPTKIDATQLVIKSNVDSTKFQNLSFYVLNTEATIQITFNSGKILGQIDDEDKGKVQYRVLLNDLPYFPNDGSFTRLAPSPVDINLNISERDMHFDKDNKLRVEFKDYWGNTDYWQTTFAGTYTGLMFMNESGEYLSDTFGGILKYLDFGMIFAGQTTLDQKVVIKNQLGYPIDNLLLEVNKEKLPEGVKIELSRAQSPFLATDYITYGLTKPLETQEFYVRIVADIEAKPVPNGIFELKINSNKAV
ncbi:hypothetical protein [Paenibacillus polymyxa]|uniref:hypothetical protein n=1 Tax=Paenibacillus polymyxa TaxID=1406 RepID=UPI00287F70A5|nr:hypothetical protein [Paenibacillus polymyxa]